MSAFLFQFKKLIRYLILCFIMCSLSPSVHSDVLPVWSVQGSWYPLRDWDFMLKRAFYKGSNQLVHINLQLNNLSFSARQSIGIGLRSITPQHEMVGYYALLNRYAAHAYNIFCNISLGREKLTRTSHTVFNVYLPCNSIRNTAIAGDFKMTFFDVLNKGLLTGGIYASTHRVLGIFCRVDYALASRVTFHGQYNMDTVGKGGWKIGVGYQNYSLTSYAPHGAVSPRAKLLHIPIRHYEFQFTSA